MSEEHFSVVRGYLAVNEANTEEPLEVPELFPVKKPNQPKKGVEEPLLPPTMEDLFKKDKK